MTRNIPHVDFDGLVLENHRELIQVTGMQVGVCMYLQVHGEAEVKATCGVLLHMINRVLQGC